MKKIALAFFLCAALMDARGADTWRYERAELIRVVDGDTIDMDIDLGFAVHVRERFRLARIDTPERSEAGWAEATAALKYRLTGAKLTADVKGRDKYGRWLVELYANGKNVNDTMLADRLAKPYP
jgi:micrococcal nuclease